jgi:predicted transcriptional regulator
VARRHNDLTSRILDSLKKDPGQQIQELARGLKINRTFLAGYLKALESEGKVKSKRIGPAKVYFRGDNVKGEGK